MRRIAVLWICAILTACAHAPTKAAGRQVIVLGVDGMDPDFVERHWQDLPNLSRLRHEGTFTRLETTTPPQSPTAWSTFITGLDPAEHGIFDFVHRDPATMQPFLSYTEPPQPPRFALPIGPYSLPLTSSRLVSLRRGKPFWQTLEERGVPVTVLRMPTNYPPAESGDGLSGMGTPDLRGTQGTFTYFSDDPGDTPGVLDGGDIVRASVDKGRAILRLEGPQNSLRRDRQSASTDLIVDVDPERPFTRISAGPARAIVREGQWSDWLPVEFQLIPHLASVRGAVRLYAKQLHPRFELYVSPVNVDPESPGLPISSPASYSANLTRDIGRFYTLGIPEDTAALRRGVFNLDQFLFQTQLVMRDENTLLDHALQNFTGGLLFFYFSSVDQNSHILWGQHDAELLRAYRHVDEAIGRARQQKPQAQLMVLSDHGFASFDRAVNLNRWLQKQGLLTWDDQKHQIDWTHTKVYALGLNAVYLNMAGREQHGIVHAGQERTAIIDQVRAGLLSLRDPATSHAAIEAVTDVHAAAWNARIAPDLIVGYARGSRASWETGTGGLGAEVFEDNTDAWIADHCINPADVPGVFFNSARSNPGHLSIKDVPALITGAFTQ